MCTAGLASMFLCYDNLLQDGFVKCDQGPKTQAVLRPLNKGLEWMDSHFEGAINGRDRGIGNIFYLLYGVERVGLASGYKYFGKADWYKIGAEKLLGMQGGNGAWEAGGYGAVVNTSYALLFLVRGRHAILFNKLDFDGDWNNRPRDLASLTRTIGRRLRGEHDQLADRQPQGPGRGMARRADPLHLRVEGAEVHRRADRHHPPLREHGRDDLQLHRVQRQGLLRRHPGSLQEDVPQVRAQADADGPQDFHHQLQARQQTRRAGRHADDP